MDRVVDLVADLGEGLGQYTMGDDAALLGFLPALADRSA